MRTFFSALVLFFAVICLSQVHSAHAGLCEQYRSIQVDGASTSITANVPSDVTYTYPNWSSDGSKMTYSAYKSGTEYAVCLYDKATQAISTFLTVGGSGSYAYFYPLFYANDSTKLALVEFNINRGGNASLIRIYNINDSSVIVDTIGQGYLISYPRFSPQGNYLVYLEDGKFVRLQMSDKTETVFTAPTDYTAVSTAPLVDDSGHVYGVVSGSTRALVKYTSSSTDYQFLSTSGADHMIGLTSDQSTLLYDYGSSTYVKTDANSTIVGSSSIYKISVGGGSSTVLVEPSGVSDYAKSAYGGTLIRNNNTDYLVYIDCDLDDLDDNSKPICNDANTASKWRLMIMNLSRETKDTMWSTEDYINPLMFQALGTLASFKEGYNLGYYALNDADADGYAIDQDCDDADADAHPGAVELANWMDDDCDGTVDEGTTLYDDDGDGYCEGFLDVCETTVWLINDCDDANANIHPNAPDITDNIDNDCDATIDEDFGPTDDDGDGQTEADGDCNDANADIYCGNSDVPANSIDNDCDGLVDDPTSGDTATDDDGDGYSEVQGDCSDLDKTMYPGADEWNDGVDNNCNCQIDEDDEDSDGDGYVNSVDCNDADGSIHPEATDTYGDSIDSNCDGDDESADDVDGDGVVNTTDNCDTAANRYQEDQDSDGIGDTCDEDRDGDGVTVAFGDCDDSNPEQNPAMIETCNGIDDNCSGVIDESVQLTFYQDADGDGHGNAAVSTQACAVSAGYVSTSDDCNDESAAAYPAAEEVADTIDNDCDGLINEGTDSHDDDGDGYSEEQGDCDDANTELNPGASEVTGNSIDDNCNGQVDESTCDTYYPDADADGYGDAAASGQSVCEAPAGFTNSNSDCDDANASINPSIVEVVGNQIDDNCNGETDEAQAPAESTPPPTDADADGYVANSDGGNDCDDANASIHPDAVEVTGDTIDNDCDGKVDETSLTKSARVTSNNQADDGFFGCSLSPL